MSVSAENYQRGDAGEVGNGSTDVVEKSVQLSVAQWDEVSSHLEAIQSQFGVRLCVRVQRRVRSRESDVDAEPSIAVSISGYDVPSIRRAEEFVASICADGLMSLSGGFSGKNSPTDAATASSSSSVVDASPPPSPTSPVRMSPLLLPPPSASAMNNNNNNNNNNGGVGGGRHFVLGPLTSAPASFDDKFRHDQLRAAFFGGDGGGGGEDEDWAAVEAESEASSSSLRQHYHRRQLQRRQHDARALLYGSVLPPELTIVTSDAGCPPQSSSSAASAMCVTGGGCGPCGTPVSSVTYVVASSMSRPTVSTSLSSSSSGVGLVSSSCGGGVLGLSLSAAVLGGLASPTCSFSGGGGGDKRPCRKLESEDSSYETDREDGVDGSPSSSASTTTAAVGAASANPFVSSPTFSLFGSAPPVARLGKNGRIFHEDLDRTLSETLGREFQEYVTLANCSPSPMSSASESTAAAAASAAAASATTRPGTASPQHQHHPQVQHPHLHLHLAMSASTSSSATPVTPPAVVMSAADPNYSSKLEFALKLGYTERQVQLTLARLGPNPTQNELLEELIKVSTGPGFCAGGGGGGGAGADADDVFALGDESDLVPGFGLSLQFGASGSKESNLRHVVIDGSNVAMSHGNKEVFSCRGIRLAVDWFRARGHQEITVFVPKWRKEASRPETPIRDQEILLELERERRLVFTPSRLVGGRRLICYDDRYILKLAVETDGIVVSNDNYRDLAQESPDFKRIIEERILMYSFVNDRFMPPDDPLGRNGPTLASFLRRHAPLRCSLSTPVNLSGSAAPGTTGVGGAAVVVPGVGVDVSGGPPLCPYGKKCTYGNKCKYLHPERGNMPHKTVTEKLQEKAQKRLQEVKARQQLQLQQQQQQHHHMLLHKPIAVRGESSPVASSVKQPTKGLKPEEGRPPLAAAASLAGAPGMRKSPLTRTVSGVRMVEKSKSVDNFALAASMAAAAVAAESSTSSSSFGSSSSLFAPTRLDSPPPPPLGLLSVSSAAVPSQMSPPLAPPRLSPPPPPLSTASSASAFVPVTSQASRFHVGPRLSDPAVGFGGLSSVVGAGVGAGAGGAGGHRKLQRQLTLNPEYDPRLLHMKSGAAGGIVPPPLVDDPSFYVNNPPPMIPPQQQQQQQQQPPRLPPPSVLLLQQQQLQHRQQQHHQVSRIASAPDSGPLVLGLPTLAARNSTSDSQLNVGDDPLSTAAAAVVVAPPPPSPPLGGCKFGPISPPQRAQQHHRQQLEFRGSLPLPPPSHHQLPPHADSLQSQQDQESRRFKIYYHLAHVFPEEQVRAAMRACPNETSPEKICAHILGLSPSRSPGPAANANAAIADPFGTLGRLD